MSVLRLPVPACPSAHWFRQPGPHDACRFRVRSRAPAAVQAQRPAGVLIDHAGYLPFQRSFLRAGTGSPRFPGKPSRGFASFSDPGRSVAPCPCMRHSGAAPTARKMKAPTLRITRLHSGASPPAVYASRRALPHAMPHSLPAGGLTFAGRGSNPQACDERFQPTSWFPPLQGLAWRNRASCPEGWPGSTPIPAPNPCRQARFPETGSVRSPRERERLHVRHRVGGDEPESAVPIGRPRVPTRTDTEISPGYYRQFNVSVLLAAVNTTHVLFTALPAPFHLPFARYCRTHVLYDRSLHSSSGTAPALREQFVPAAETGPR